MPKNDSKEKLVKASEKDAIELSETALQRVSGGMTDIQFTKHVDRSSPILMQSTSTNKTS
jgi:type VI protein secretion system component Hcp